MRSQPTKRLRRSELPPSGTKPFVSAVASLEQTADLLERWALRREKVLHLLDVRAAQDARRVASVARRVASDLRSGDGDALAQRDGIERDARRILATSVVDEDLELFPELNSPPLRVRSDEAQTSEGAPKKRANVTKTFGPRYS
ncbi:MAG: hypothetical protein U0414_12065 [Polyangiaceae bacterium]